jgi:hypothetical protein
VQRQIEEEKQTPRTDERKQQQGDKPPALSKARGAWEGKDNKPPLRAQGSTSPRTPAPARWL